MTKLIALLAALLLGQSAPPPVPASASGAAGTLLVGNKGENTVSFIDLATGRELGRAETGPMPHEIAVSPDGRQAAVVSYGGRSIDLFDIATRRRLRAIDLSLNEGPHGIAWLPDGRIVATTERSRSLTIVDPRRNDAVRAVPTGEDGTHMVAVSADARRAYTTNIQSGSVSVIDLATGRLIRTIRLGGRPEAIALSPDGRTLWVGDLEGARVQAFDTAMLAGDARRFAPAVNISYEVANGSEAEVRSAVVAPLERAMRGWPGAGRVESRLSGNRGWTQVTLAPGMPLPAADDVVARVRAVASGFPPGRTEITPRILSTAPLAIVSTGPTPIRVAISPDGRQVVSSDLGSGGLTVIDARTRRVARAISVSGEAQAAQVTILFSADGRRLYAAETGRNQVAEIDMASGRVLRRLAAGRQGDGLAIAPVLR